MTKNPFNDVLFAVTREDYLVESQVIKTHGFKKLLTVCSGGCVPLSLKMVFPKLSILAFDINPHQIDHVKKKVKLVAQSDYHSLNVGKKDNLCLNQSGKFEKMFQNFRKSFISNVADINDIKTFFNPETPILKKKKIVESWILNKNILNPFNDVFNDLAIEKVFSKRATQQAKKGTYIHYFKNKIIGELKKRNSCLNPFLQHIFLGYYMSATVFPYIKSSNKIDIDYLTGTVYDVPNIESFDFVSLSNLFDWGDDVFVSACAKHLFQLKKGSAVLLRQLNNKKDWSEKFEPSFFEDTSFNSYWKTHDRSMFYDKFRLFIKK